MLHLEKKRKDISVCLRDRQKLFSRTFLYALGFALSIHLLAALIFHIHPFIILENTLFAPTVVEADLRFVEEPEGSILAYMEKEEHPSRYFLEPTPSDIQIPQLEFKSEKQYEYLIEPNVFVNPFESIEEDLFAFLDIDRPPMSVPAIQVKLCGELQEKVLSNFNLEAVSRLKIDFQSTRSFRANYHVRVDGSTGKIFWYMPASPLEESAQRVSEKIFQQISFKPDPALFVFAGEIEVVITLPEVYQPLVKNEHFESEAGINQ